MNTIELLREINNNPCMRPEKQQAISSAIQALELLEKAGKMLPEKRESPKGKDCECHAYEYFECGCGADWSDNDGWNACIDLCTPAYAKLLEENERLKKEIGAHKSLYKEMLLDIGSLQAKLDRINIDEISKITVGLVEKNFPKGVSKERGAAIVLHAEMLILICKLKE